MKIHQIKCWPKYFHPLVMEQKTFEVRKNDRGYGVGDLLVIEEWDPETQRYTGRRAFRSITYMIQGECGLPDDICVMGLE